MPPRRPDLARRRHTRGLLLRRAGHAAAWSRLAALLALLSLLGSGLLAGAGPVAAAPAVQLSALAAFGGNYRPDEWLPVTVLIANDGSAVSGDVVVEPATSRGGERYVQRVELPTRSRKELTLYALVPDYTTELKVRFTSGKDTVAAPPVAVRALKRDQRLVGVVADDARSGGTLASSLLAAYGSAVEVVTVATAELPGNPFGLGSFSALVLNDASTGGLAEEQRRALADWVARGGQLVVAGGPTWRKTAEGLGDLLPVRPNDSRAVSDLGGLAQFARGRNSPSGSFVVAIGTVQDGAAPLAEQGGVPLVAARGWGRGMVLYLAFDPSAPGVLTWGDAGGFWRRLGLDAPLPSSLQEPFGSSFSGPQVGAGSVDRILRDFPSLGLPPTWLLLLVMLLFIAVVGPVNYLVLKRLDRRELGWLTIPAITLLFAGGIYAVGAGTRGTSVVVNTVSLVRIAPGQRAAEAQSFFGVFTPSRGVRQLSVGRDALLAGFGSGGIGQSDLGGEARFEQGAQASVRDAYFAQWTLRSVAARAMVDPAPLALRLDLGMDGGRIVGRITNPSGETVEDVVLLLNGRYTRLGELPAGGSVAVDWSPATGPGVSSGLPYGSYPGYGGLGTALYYNSGAYPSSSQRRGTTAYRAELLDALTGTVLASGQAVGTQPSRPPVRGTPVPVRPPASSSASGAQGGQPPLQVLYWRGDAPLDLKLGFGSSREVTSLVIQETYVGGQTPDRAPTVGAP